jgi:hypothetical protein
MRVAAIAAAGGEAPDEPLTKEQQANRKTLREFIGKAPHLNVAKAGTRPGKVTIAESRDRDRQAGAARPVSSIGTVMWSTT